MPPPSSNLKRRGVPMVMLGTGQYFKDQTQKQGQEDQGCLQKRKWIPPIPLFQGLLVYLVSHSSPWPGFGTLQST